jgi:hypothetical protein
VCLHITRRGDRDTTALVDGMPKYTIRWVPGGCGIKETHLPWAFLDVLRSAVRVAPLSRAGGTGTLPPLLTACPYTLFAGFLGAVASRRPVCHEHFWMCSDPLFGLLRCRYTLLLLWWLRWPQFVLRHHSDALLTNRRLKDFPQVAIQYISYSMVCVGQSRGPKRGGGSPVGSASRLLVPSSIHQCLPSALRGSGRWTSCHLASCAEPIGMVI